jgi:sortase (surface protein transpeptidase)
MKAMFLTTDELEVGDMVVWREDEVYEFVQRKDIPDSHYKEVWVRDDSYEYMLTTAEPWNAWTVVRLVEVEAEAEAPS